MKPKLASACFLIAGSISAQLPDLTTIAPPKSSYKSGQRGVQILVSVLRSGGKLTRGSYVQDKLFLSTDSRWSANDTQLWVSSATDFLNSWLNTYGIKVVTATLNIPNVRAGTYYILSVVDPTNYHPESNETNNVSAYRVSIISSLLAKWITRPPSSITAGQRFQVSFSLAGNPTHYNIHWDPTDPRRNGCCLGPINTTSSSTNSPTSSPVWLTAPTHHYPSNNLITSPTRVRYVVHARITSTSENAYSGIVDVIVNPKVQPPTVSWIQAPPSSITVGQPFTVSWRMAGNPTHYNVHWDPTNPKNSNCCRNPIYTTSSSTNSPTPSPVTIKAPTHHYQNNSLITSPIVVYYAVHVKNQAGEGYSSIIPVTVNPKPPSLPDLTIQANLFGRTTFKPGETGVKIQVTTRRAGGPLTQNQFVDSRLFFSTDSVWDSSDVQLWSAVYASSILNSQGIVQSTAVVRIPIRQLGNYYILAVVDANKAHKESNENNNTSAYSVSLQGNVPPVINLRVPWDKPGDLEFDSKNWKYGQNWISKQQYWVVQTYDSHITGLTGQGPCKPDPGYSTSARYAVDFYYSKNQKTLDCEERSTDGKHKNIRAAHSGIFRIKYDNINKVNFLDIESNSFRTRYVHLKINPNLRDRQFVCAGEVIGKFYDVAANLVHLHFEVWRKLSNVWNRAPLDDKQDVLLDGEVVLLGSNSTNMCSGYPRNRFEKCKGSEKVYRYPSIPRKSFTPQYTYGVGTLGCKGVRHIFNSNSQSEISNRNYGICCTNVPPNSVGLIFMGPYKNFQGYDYFSIKLTIYLDLPRGGVFWAIITSDSTGRWSVPIPIQNLNGLRIFTQVFWLWDKANACTPPPSPLSWSSSNGLEIMFFKR